ncbi:CRISPR system precrRNA processing endoribonuclease RAMP protein Cas6 [Sulfolobus sp. S-194]|uniref:CRISPR system precrRNA processing endoribonuclease RAMP protein Cas6 n=1 Tax=Sulfolobus sp. S-194 TaxID=2512240 RepID=UPI0014373BA5|nr:CRISPR system precrRNA processing endoribonuclease RAMP protein Cas6 [Sulfolobus sp. S-194]QIW22823.1 CRISPR system precrRNA processing endoribonuclease RAMP protein Cas6 [Sulfolobus sp. S-194]
MVEFLPEKIIKAEFSAVPETDVILPPLSSKVVKNLILSSKLLPSLSNLVQSGMKNKPIFISNLGKNGFRLFSTGKPISVKTGEILNFFISFPYYDGFFTELSSGSFKTEYGKFFIELEQLEVIELNSIKGVSEGNFYIKFVTPALLSSKVLLPPSLKEKYKNVNPGYSLIPSVGLVVSYAYRIYRALYGNTSNIELESKAFKLGILSNSLSRVVGYKLKPLTVVIGNDDKGRLRTSRGFVGWMEFDIPYKKLKKAVWKYLTVASFLGIGKSRGIGLGEIALKMKNKYSEISET